MTDLKINDRGFHVVSTFLSKSGCIKTACESSEIKGFSTYENRWGDVVEVVEMAGGFSVPRPIVSDTERGAIEAYRQYLQEATQITDNMINDLDESEEWAEEYGGEEIK